MTALKLEVGMNYFRSLMLVAVVFAGSVSVAQAEQGCADGFIPNAAPTGTPGQNQCVPIPGLSRPGTPSAPTPQWAKRWGAIAYDPTTGKVGVASDMTSKRKAVNGALAHCRSKGGTACAINIDYSNQCAAIVYGGGGEIVKSAAASAATTDEAEGLALKNCREAAGVECQVFYSGCSYPQRVQ
ncbi:DUF4189 domain-containing protein [Lysobacter gummosus]|uniref:DUF4189 domain-containing protein n=1 Tax=Lysobacter gummosus TaxID=262324 RepID=A0ABY3XAJ4_9GAMM|nr:DUF4189 domain-containing protein [Lysobacter gummosus]UNP27441.1 DUF4189 domain-containing protein [Lysobacter gummosus]